MEERKLNCPKLNQTRTLTWAQLLYRHTYRRVRMHTSSKKKKKKKPEQHNNLENHEPMKKNLIKNPGNENEKGK